MNIFQNKPKVNEAHQKKINSFKYEAKQILNKQEYNQFTSALMKYREKLDLDAFVEDIQYLLKDSDKLLLCQSNFLIQIQGIWVL